MPKRSFRAEMNKSNFDNSSSRSSSRNDDSNNKSNIDNNCGKKDDLNSLTSNSVPESMPAEHGDPTEALFETKYAPKELKRQIADALKETSMENDRSGKVTNKTKKPALSACEDKKHGKIVYNCNENSSEKVKKKIEYADVVRSTSEVEKKGICKNFPKIDNMNLKNKKLADLKKTFSEKQDVEKPLANPSRSNNKSEVASNKINVASDKSEVSSEGSLRECDTRDASLKVSKSDKSEETLNKLITKLKIIQELEINEPAWEVVSNDEWSHCGSDSDEQFLLINEDVDVDTGDGSGVSDGGCGTAGAESSGTTARETASGDSATRVLQSTSSDVNKKKKCISSVDQVSKVVTTGPSAVASASTDVTSTTNNTGSNNVAIDSKKSGAAGTASAPTAAADIASAPTAAPAPIKKVPVTRKYMARMDFMQRLERLNLRRVESEEEMDTMQWTGVYKTGQLMVEAWYRYNFLMVSVRAECETSLLSLTCIESFVEDTGLLSQDQLNMTALMKPQWQPRM